MKKLLALLCALLLLGGCTVQEPEKVYQEPVPTLTPPAICATYEPLPEEEVKIVLGTAEDYARIREILTALTPESLTGFTCWSNTGYMEPLTLDEGSSYILYDEVMSLTATVKEKWSNPPTGGGWNVVLENSDHQLCIGFNGEWLWYTLDGTSYVFNAEDIDAGYAIDSLIYVEIFNEADYPQLKFTLNDYLNLDADVVESLEIKNQPFGPAVETGLLLTGGDAQAAVRELGEVSVTPPTADSEGSAYRRYVIRYTDGRAPLVLFEDSDFHYGAYEGNIFCTFSPRSASDSLGELTIPKNAATVYYDTTLGEW